jgi:gliding motility-associated-like protein
LQRAGGTGNDEALDMFTDANGDHWVTGYISAQAAFGANVLPTAGFSDVFVAKYGSNGNLIWAKSYGGNSPDRGYAIIPDGAGGAIVAGFFMGQADFDGIVLNAAGGSQDVFVMRVDGNGNVLWAIREGGTDAENIYGLAIDPSGNVIVTGQFKGASVIGGQTFNSTIDGFTGQPGFDIFVAKYDANGNNLWVKAAQAPYDDRGLAAGCDNSGNIYITGEFSDTLHWDGTTVINNQIMAAGYLMKLDPNGNQVWFRYMAASQTLMYGLAVAPNNDVVLAGEFRGQMAVFGMASPYLINDTYFYKAAVIRFNSNGEILWSNTLSSANEVGYRDVALDAQGNAYAVGLFKCSLTEMADALGDGVFYSLGWRDVVLARYNADGTQEWVNHYGSNKDDFCSGIGVSGVDEPVIAGGFQNKLVVPIDYSLPPNNFQNSFSGYSNFCPNDPAPGAYSTIPSEGYRDIFVIKPYFSGKPTIDFYRRTVCPPQDFVPAEISPFDTLVNCGPITIAMGWNQYISYDTLIYPIKRYSWDGQYTGVINTYYVAQTGTHHSSSSRLDGCYTDFDTVHVIINPFPTCPMLTDNFGFNQAAFCEYEAIKFCYPDTAWITLSGVDPGNTYTWLSPDIPAGVDTIHVGLLTHGHHGLVVTNTHGCSDLWQIFLQVDEPGINQPLSPSINYLAHNTQYFTGDTIELCEEEYFDVIVHDLFSSGPGVCSGSFPFYAAGLSINGMPYYYSGAQYPCYYRSFPLKNVSGWYYFKPHLISGYENLCGLDTNHYYGPLDSIFIVLHPNPTVDAALNAQQLLCPGDSGFVTLVSLNAQQATWLGGTLAGQQVAVGDTMWVFAPGTYGVNITTINPVTGCSASDIVYTTILLKPDPKIFMVPQDGVVCPGDSVLMTGEPGVSWVWYGPSGQIVGNTQSIWASTPGFYHYIHEDFDGCVRTSETAELKEYNSPYLIADPGTHLCANGSVNLTAIYSGTASIYWHPPVNSTNATVNVQSGGTYVCEATQCGFTTTMQIVITQSNTPASITIQNPVICPGDSTIFSAVAGPYSYEWSNGMTGPFIYVNNAQPVTVTVTDVFGCFATSAPAVLNFHPATPIPVAQDTAVCFGDVATLEVIGGLQDISWYASPTSQTVLHVGSTFVTPPVNSNVSYYVSHNNGVCTSQRTEVKVTIRPSSITPVINGPAGGCPNSTITLSTPQVPGVDYQWIGPNGAGPNSDSWTLSPFTFAEAGQYSLSVSDAYCSSGSAGHVVMLYPQPTPQITVSNDTICQGMTAVLQVNQTFQGYLWSNGQSGAVTNVSSSGYYWATVTNAQGCVGNSDTVYVHVLPGIPAPSIADVVVCQGDSVSFSPGGANPFIWWSMSGNIDTAYVWNSGPLHQSQFLLVYATDGNGCISAPDSVIIQVIPTGSATIVTASAYCEGDSIMLYSLPLAGVGYSWTSPSGTTHAGNVWVIHQASLAHEGWYHLTTSNGICTATDSAFIHVVQQPLNPGLLADTLLCASHPLEIALNGTTSYDYAISNNTTAWFALNQPLIIPATDTTHSGWYYSVVVDGACASALDSIYITIDPGPSYPYIYEYGGFCLGDSLMLLTDTTTSQSYTWTLPNGSQSTDSYLSLTPLSASHSGYYTLQTEAFGCLSPIDTFEVVVQIPPIITLGVDTAICAGSTLELTPGAGFDYYFWQDTTFNETYIVSDSGTYTVWVGLDYCMAEATIHISLINCQLLIPNIFSPNGDGINDVFRVQTDPNNHLNISLMNRWGQPVYSDSGQEISWDGNHYITGIKVPEGTYFYVIELTSEDGVKQFHGTVNLVR